MSFTYQHKTIEYTPLTWKFPSGEVGVQLQPRGCFEYDVVTIKGSLKSNDCFFELALLVDALRRDNAGVKISLLLGYMSYGRQDRIMRIGESISVAVMANLLDSLNLNLITIIDPHSGVTEVCFKTPTRVIRSTQIIEQYMPLTQHKYTLVGPDEGAYKRLKGMAWDSGILYATKQRNGDDMVVTFNQDVKGKQCVVVDDICDGGKTFILLGEKLKEAGAKSIDLFITHGIFTKGHEPLTEVYDRVYTTNSYHTDRTGVIDGVEYIKII